MRMLEFDLETYNRTKDLPGGPVCTVVETEYPEFETIVDAEGRPTLGGRIGNALASAIIVGFICVMFYVL